MNTCETDKTKTNWGMVFFTIITGLILITNLFDYITWQIWEIGVYLIGGIIFLHVIYKLICKKKWAFKILQISVFFLVLTLLSHTVLAVIKPGYLGAENSDLTPYEIYNHSMELRTDYYPEIATKKEMTITINEEEYSITDSNDHSYYFRTHPPKGGNEDIFIAHKIAESILKIDIGSKNYKLNPIQQIIGQHPTVILGTPNISTIFETKAHEAGILNINLRKQQVEIMRGVVRGGNINLKFSKESLPQERFLFTARDGEHTISLPRDIGHEIKYNVRGDGELTIEGNQLIRAGKYEIISREGKNPCIIEVNADGGKIKILTH